MLQKIFGTAGERTVRRYKRIVAQINKRELELQALSDDQLTGQTDLLKKRLAKGETVDDILVDAYAVVKNACRRLCGKERYFRSFF